MTVNMVVPEEGSLEVRCIIKAKIAVKGLFFK
jgi:hypothetical protein